MLGDVTKEELGAIIRASCGRSPLPETGDPAVRARVRGLAEQAGLIAQIQKELTPGAPIPVLRRSDFRAFKRVGQRGAYDVAQRARTRQLDLATLACYLEMDYVDYLQDLLWAECENSWWIAPAHEYVEPLDLLSTMNAERYATVLGLLGDKLEAEVRERVVREVQRRIFEEYLAPRTQHFWWRRTGNNWNSVCNGGIAIAAMILEKDPQRLEQIVVRAIEDLPPFVEDFSADGGCSEGPSYWRYGFGWYLKLADALRRFTGGRVNIMQGEHLARICRYPLAMAIAPGRELTLADAFEGYQSVATVSRINQFYPLPELWGLCELDAQGHPKVTGLEDLLGYDGRAVTPLVDPRDYLLPNLGVVKVKMGAVTVGAKGGHNNEHHNHNDVGSFIVHRGQTQLLCDPGAPIYSARTFNHQRYESMYTNSRGHSVPVINGQLQRPGEEYRGTLVAEGLNGGGLRRVRIEMAGAYGLPTLERLTRVLEIPTAAGEIVLSDTFVFREMPTALEESFSTTSPVEAAADGQSVLIRSEKDGVARVRVLAGAGTFRVEELREESKESARKELLRRIVFTPARLAQTMELRFGIQVE